jgi:hypothetical protein
LRNARWPDQIPGIGWEQGTELDWLRRFVSYWANEFDWRGWERRLNAFDHFTWEGWFVCNADIYPETGFWEIANDNWHIV